MATDKVKVNVNDTSVAGNQCFRYLQTSTNDVRKAEVN